MLWMLRSGFFGLMSLALPMGCMPKKKTDAEVNFAVGNWWQRPDSNLLLAVAEKRSVSVCLRSEGRVEPATWTRDKIHFEKIVRSALSDWLSAIAVQAQINFVEPSCVNDLAQGRLQVVLHYDEALFQSRISQTTSPTLGVFLGGDGGLHLNVRGVLNPSRDATAGYKTTLHELGHAMGLNHSQVAGAVMQPMLSRASSRLTADDIAGLREIWTRINQQNPSVRGGVSSSAQAEMPERTPIRATESQPIEAPNPAATATAQPSSKSTSVQLVLRYDSWFKVSTTQSYLLPESQKCALGVDQKIVVQVLDGGVLQSGHLRVKLAEDLPGCGFARSGAVGFLYSAHID